VQRFNRFLVDFRLVRCWPTFFSLILMGSPVLYGQDTWQSPTNGSWFTPGNWTLERPPTARENAFVDNGTIAQIGPGVEGEHATAATLTIGATTPGSTVQLLPSGELDIINPLIIGAEGTLLFSDGDLSGGGNIIHNDGTVAFETPSTPGDERLVHNIDGAGKLIVDLEGTSILRIFSTNTYSGETLLIGGTLQAESTTALSPNSAFTVNSTLDLNGFSNTIGSLSGTGTVLNNGAATATLTVGNDNSDSTFGGVLQNGTGVLALIKSGTGVLTLTGANTYTGGTTISAGTLQIGNGGTTGSLTGNVIDNGALVFNRSDAVTFDGVISGQGTLVKQGGGTLTLTGMSTEFTGPTMVNDGSLIVDGSIGSTQTLVNPGGSLGGHGLLGGDLVNSGIVSPSNSLQGLRVAGNYTQNANGTLLIGVGGTLPGQFSLLQVGGHASLGGTLQLMQLGGFQLHIGDKLTFLTAGSVSGSFSTIQNPFLSNTLVKAQITVLPGAVVLQGTQGSFTEVAMTPNCLAVARALDSLVGDPRAAALINFLNSEPLSRLCPVDFNLIAPDQLTLVFNVTVSLANVQSSNLERRMDDVRGGSTGFSSAGFTMNGVTPGYSAGLAGPTGTEGKGGQSVMAPIPENRWGVFVTGLGEFTHVDSTDIARGFDLQTGGVTFGVDYRIGSNFALGLIAGYAHTNADLANNGNLDINTGEFGLYGTAFSGGFYLDSAITGAISGYDTHRAALLGNANGSTNGGDLNVLVNAGYDWKKGGLSIGPTASFQYTYVSLDGFTESGSLAPLKFNDQHTDSIRSAFGMKASYDWKVDSILIRPELRAAWQHEYGRSSYSIVASFANGAGNSFTVSSPSIGRDSLLLGAGVAVLWSDRISTYIYYDGELARSNYQSNNVSAGVRITF
jgi:outer membrane autotransporter protein